MKLKILYPCFRLALPPKRWFGNNFDPIFLEDRLLGLQAFLNNITGHKEIRKSAPVKEFLCLNDPPGPHDSLEESRVMVESLEEVAYNLKRDLAERDRLLRKRDEEIARLKARLQELENAGLPLESEPVGTDQESESSTVEGDQRSCVEADLMDHGIPDANVESVSDSMDNSLKVKIETLGKEPGKIGNMVGERDRVAMAISQSTAPVVGDSR
ncbi:sorting nexin-16-like [Lytechinus pictus]|uniref:sorting nexin-16-like n=1 Tax=Lytechinus pictus TaxID=7653 RepID=UPI0030B9E187